jgi:hypothetical protein
MPRFLRVQPGDVVRLILRNQGSLPSNHGFNVTPLGAGDNVFIQVNPANPTRPA